MDHYALVHTALQFEHGIDVSASQRDFRFLQKSQLRFARVRFRGVVLILVGVDVCGLAGSACTGLIVVAAAVE